MNLDREWIRGAAPLAVLTLLETREMYGYELVEALERRSGGLLELGQSVVGNRQATVDDARQCVGRVGIEVLGRRVAEEVGKAQALDIAS